MNPEYVAPVEVDEDITDPTERFIVKVSDFKQSLGLWYQLVALRILPFVLFIIPVNVVIGRFNGYFMTRFLTDVNPYGTIMLVMWIVAMIVFLAATIFVPKLATVFEFVIGITYLYFAFKHQLFTNLLGLSLLIVMIVFLLVKLVFLVFEIIKLRAFKDDKLNNIERDESGRVVREAGGEVFFTQVNDNVEGQDAISVSDDDVYFATNEVDESEPIVQSDDQVVFAGKDEYENKDGSISASDNDFFFG